MASAPASAAFNAARRRLFDAVFAAVAPPTDPLLSRRRPGRDGLLDDLPASPESLTSPLA